MVAGAAPPAAMIEGMEKIGFDLTHVYGLTETYGPATVCAKHDEWDALDIGKRAERNGRQGVRYLMQEGLTVMDAETMTPVPADGETMGEIMFRGNITMKGYLKNPKATRGSVRRRLVPFRRPGGDAARRLRQDQGPLQGHHHFRRREHFLARSRGRALPPSGGARGGGGGAARPEMGRDALRLRRAEAGRAGDGARKSSSIAAAIWRASRCRKAVVFGELPKTSTGKIQKFVLRQQAKSAQAIE